jgi:hypothetical protein
MVAIPASVSGRSRFSHEMQLVLLLSRMPLSSQAAEMISAALCGDLDWDRIFALARIQEVEPVVMTNLLEEFSESLPVAIRDAAMERQRESKGASLARTLVLLELLHEIRAELMDVIVMKGPVMGIYAYGHPSLRTFSDLDILVRSEQLEHMEQLLKGKGYTPLFGGGIRQRLLDGGHALEYSNDKMKVELHCVLFPRYLRFGLDESAVWLDKTQLIFDGLILPAPSRAMSFLLACAHAAKHEWSSLRLISDAGQLLARLSVADATEVLGLAEKARAVRLVELGVNLVREVFGLESSPFAQTLGVSHDTTRGLVDLVVTRMAGQKETGTHARINRIDPWLGPLVFWARSRENLLDRALCLLQPAARRALRALLG